MCECILSEITEIKKVIIELYCISRIAYLCKDKANIHSLKFDLPREGVKFS